MTIPCLARASAGALLWLLANLSAAQTLIVSSLDDSGTGSLRDLMEAANTNPGPDIIEFEEGLTGIITLQSALPAIVENLEILGPGADLITISGSQAHRVFLINQEVQVTLSALRIAEGRAQAADSADSGFAPGLGGGIRNLGSLMLIDSLVTDCVADDGGGGIANEGELLVMRSAIINNVADPGAFATGGGIDNFAGVVSLVESTVSGNTSDSGGGITNSAFDAQGALLTITNSTISGNSAGFLGGGIDNFEGLVELVNVTIVGNSIPEQETGQGGGGIFSDGTATIKHTIIAENSGSDCGSGGGALSVTGLSLDADGSCAGFSTASTAALALGALASNGGPTQTHALGADSVALNVAADCTMLDGTPVANDQRGVPRPQGSACDVGAFERELDADPDDVLFADRFQGL